MKTEINRALRLRDENEGRELIAMHTNRGDPYREGVDLLMQGKDYRHITSAFLENAEARELKDWLVEIYSPVMEMRLCEASRVQLKPDQLYRFTVDRFCPACREAEARSKPA
jgi:hypothetical protein